MLFNESNHAKEVANSDLNHFDVSLKLWSLVYFVAALVIIIMLLLCLSYVQHLLMNSSLFRKNAYSNLVKHGFFEIWIIQDLYGLIYNPPLIGIQNRSSTNYGSII